MRQPSPSSSYSSSSNPLAAAHATLYVAMAAERALQQSEALADYLPDFREVVEWDLAILLLTRDLRGMVAMREEAAQRILAQRQQQQQQQQQQHAFARARKGIHALDPPGTDAPGSD